MVLNMIFDVDFNMISDVVFFMIFEVVIYMILNVSIYMTYATNVAIIMLRMSQSSCYDRRSYNATNVAGDDECALRKFHMSRLSRIS